VIIEWDGADIDREAAERAAAQRELLLARAVAAPLTIANEFAEIRVVQVETRNGTRLLIDSPKSGQWIALDPMELEALTWQTTRTFSEMIAIPDAPLFSQPSSEA
jgi:hypothetical protein